MAAQLSFRLKRPKPAPRRGRPLKVGAGVSHLRRPPLASRFPVHVTLKMRREVWNLRSRRCFSEVKKAFMAGCDRFGFRLAHYSVQGNHVHLIAEAQDAEALSRGIQGLSIRMAKGLNRTMVRRGKVFADRYHARALRTPTEVRHAVHYVAFNRHHHALEQGRQLPKAWRDPYASLPPIRNPHTWLLKKALNGH